MASSSSMQIALRYAQAWLSSLSAKDIEAVWRDAEKLEMAWQESSLLRRIMASPLLTPAKQIECFHALAKPLALQSLTLKCLQLLAQNRRLALLPEMIVAWKSLVRKAQGHVEVQVVTAAGFAKADQTKVIKAIAAKLEKEVTVHFAIDPDLLGGAVVKVGSHMLDASLKSRLDALHGICRQAVSSIQRI